MHANTRLRNTKQFTINKVIVSVILSLGIGSIIISAFCNSTILAIIGLSLTFWGAILLYITPTKHVPLELLNAVATSPLANIEKILRESNLTGKGIYLPPKYLKDFESSLIFIPLKPEQNLPTPEEIDEEKLYSSKGLFLTPPGLTLSKLFEKEIGTSFIRTDLDDLKEKLPKLFIDDMEIADDTKIRTENNTVTVEITNHIFNDICRETKELKKTHQLVGCPFSSSIACALAKATGKPITIEKEEQSQNGKTTRITYCILEE